MAQQPAYIIAVVFSSIAMFIVWLSYKFLVPVFSLVVTPIASQYPAMVGNDPTYVDGFNTIVSQTNILYQYSFIVMMLGIMSVFIMLFAYRRVFNQNTVGYEDAY